MDLVLEGVVGSTAYGLNNENSDIDRLGIFLAEPEEILSIHQPAAEESIVKNDPDVTYHELGKFCRLALKCNPTVTELLWLPEYEIFTTTGMLLIDLRHEFLSTKYVRNAYLGYATQQFEKLKARDGKNFSSDLGNRTNKHARHLARLLHQGYELYSNGVLTVKLNDPQWYIDFGNSVEAGNIDIAEELLSDYEQKFDETNSPLLLRPSSEVINEFVINTRVSQILEEYNSRV